MTARLRRARRLAPRSLTVLAPAALLLFSGCGSASAPPATLSSSRSSAPSWRVASKRTVPGRAVATIAGTVADPTALEVRVEAHPSVSSQVNYSIDCEASGTHPVAGTIAAERTPLTAAIPVLANAASCFVEVSASKSSSAAMTLTLLVRSAAAG